jgi:hypothetical protein
MALSKDEVLRIIRGPKDEWTRWFMALSPTEYVNLARALRELKSAPVLGCMPQSAVDDLAKAVPDALVRDIVNDNRKGPSVPGWLPPEKPEPRAKGSGWLNPEPLTVPSGTKYVDQIANHFDKLDREQAIADAIDKVKRIK